MATVADVEQLRADTRDLLDACDRLRAVQAEVAERLGPWMESGWWRFDGARSAEDWLGLFAQLDPVEARRLAERSRICELLPAFAAAYRAGEISGAHLDALARVVDDRRAEQALRDEAALLGAAKAEAPPVWARTVAVWRQHCDRELAHRDAEQRWQDRRFHVRPDLFGGAQLSGYLDADGAAVVSAGLAAHRNDPDPSGGPPRTLGQRNADALVALATGDEAISVTVVVDHDLANEPAGPAPRADVDGLPFPAAAAERLSCGASVSSVVRQGRSILDVTEATPTITVGQRRALLVRDPTCRFPGCTVIAARCDVHHLTHRAAGGEHRLDNLIHLCRHHASRSGRASSMLRTTHVALRIRSLCGPLGPTHRFLHESRWSTTGSPDDELHFHPPPDWDHEWLERTGIRPQRE